jgi:hypothetical protein
MDNVQNCDIVQKDQDIRDRSNLTFSNLNENHKPRKGYSYFLILNMTQKARLTASLIFHEADSNIKFFL